MSSFIHSKAVSAPFARSVAIAALMGATILVSPLTAARADTVASAALQLAQAATPQNPAAAGATQSKGETVEERITNLHAALKITPDEETKWNGVAQSMRENAAAMDDLNTYEKFAQAHVDGLKNLISSFKTLYTAMPDAQKKTADEVFKTSGRAAG